MNSTKKIKVALVHDDFIQFGGAEKLFIDILKELENDKNFEIEVFSSIFSPKWKKVFFDLGFKINESFLGALPFSYLYSKVFFINSFFYLAFESFDFSDFDFVISSSTRFGHFLVTKPTTFHISYLNSPSRALWEERKYFFRKDFFYALIKNLLPNKRIYDFYSQVYANLIISNSKNIQRKVKKIYRRNSIVLFPFINLQKIKSSNKTAENDYYILISRLTSWKRIDYVIDTFNDNKLKLIVVGEGEEFSRYQKNSQNNILLKGYVTETEKNLLLRNAKALIFPQIEDFGITILEALNYDIPILYLNHGGAKEILNERVGIGFNQQNPENLKEAISKLEYFKFSSKEAAVILKNYSKDRFISFLKKLILTVKR